MTLSEYADAINAEIKIIRYANQEERWIADFEDAEIKESKTSGVLIGMWGEGKSPHEALANYVSSIRGKILVFNAGDPKYRREFVEPVKLEA